MLSCIFFSGREWADNSQPPGRNITFRKHEISVPTWVSRPYQPLLCFCDDFQSYYLSSEVNLQEQVIRLRKLHHLLEVLGTCSSFLSLPHERLFFFTQSEIHFYVLLTTHFYKTLRSCWRLITGIVCVFLFTYLRSCLQYYQTAPYDEQHVFQMQIKPALISHFYQT